MTVNSHDTFPNSIFSEDCETNYNAFSQSNQIIHPLFIVTNNPII